LLVLSLCANIHLLCQHHSVLVRQDSTTSVVDRSSCSVLRCCFNNRYVRRDVNVYTVQATDLAVVNTTSCYKVRTVVTINTQDVTTSRWRDDNETPVHWCVLVIHELDKLTESKVSEDISVFHSVVSVSSNAA